MNKYLNSAYPFGIAGGGLCILAFLVMYYLGAEPISMNLVFGYIITPLFVFLGLKNFRDKQNSGNLYFSQGMTVGFFIYITMALVSALFVFVFLQFNALPFEEFRRINLSMLKDHQDILVEQLNLGAYNDTYESISRMTIMDVAMNDFLRKIIPGLFFTILISIILKRTIHP